MSRLFTSVLFFSMFVIASVNSARILGVYPMPSMSHQIVFRELTLELVKRGHEVVAITPDPLFKNKESPANLTEIDIGESYKVMMSILINKDMKKYIKRGAIMDADAIVMSKDENKGGREEVINSMFNFTAVKQFIEDKNQKFDLVIIEGVSYTPLIFGELFKAPIILFSSLYGTSTNYETIGAVARHPLIYPHIFRSKHGNLSILDKIKQLYMEYQLWKRDQYGENSDNVFLKSQFGPNAPTVAELKKNVVMLFVNVHPVFDGNRPVPPGTQYLGALHLKPTKELPQDLKTYLDNSTRGVVYVSLGTNVRPSHMEKEFLSAFLTAFEKLPYDILWKFDGDNLESIPNNVKIQKWFPQRDLLGHPNIKVFVMQGGLQSTDEAIDAEVPLVGIPMLGDQWFNVNKYVELGIGVEVDSYTMVADDLVKAVNTVANDPSYKENMKKLKAFMQDQPEKAIDRAVWWTEHVLRHKGSRLLLGAAAQMSWSEYLMLDVVVTLALALSILVAVAAVSVYYIVRLVLGMNKKREKNSYVKAKQN